MKAYAPDHTAAINEVARIPAQACETRVCGQLIHNSLGECDKKL